MAFRGLEDFRKRPAGLLRRFLGSFTDRIRYDHALSEERAELHLHHLSQAPRAWQVVSSRLSTYDALALRDLNARWGPIRKPCPPTLPAWKRFCRPGPCRTDGAAQGHSGKPGYDGGMAIQPSTPA